ncbi:MAG: hypothetical protein EZS28_049328 [Streblomastix strix]|uniref:Uncharacterized protein n=1 Tax=Streblomastix strix TaxID=222440 RepID=A0A5J4TCD0_9EUKA|nr:MAG: hypothetical protein EZS28_049328 [Streblomastix strix]
MAKIVGVHRASQFDPNKMEPRDSWRRSAEQNRWRYENLWSTSEPAEIQPNETSHVYADCARAVALAESALIAQIHHIIPNQPPSRYLIDAYLMCLTAGARLRSIRFAHPSQGQSRNQGPGNYRPAQLRFHLLMIMASTMEGATTTERVDTDNSSYENMESAPHRKIKQIMLNKIMIIKQ